MKPIHLLVAALVLLIGSQTPTSSQTQQKKEIKTETTKKKKPQKSITTKKQKDPALNAQSSAAKTMPSQTSGAPVIAEPIQTSSNLIGSMGESPRPIVLKDEKSPGLALGLSALLPGCGQYYNGDYVKGAVQTGVFATGIILALTLGTESSYSSNAYTDYGYYGTYTYYRPETEEWTSAWMYVGIGVAAGAWIWSVIDAPISANSTNDESAGSTYGNMIESSNPKCVVGVDVTALQGGAGVNLVVHF